jgi:hypothetical protein
MRFDHATLQGWSRMGWLGQRLGLRAKILLLLAEGLTPKEVSHQFQVSAPAALAKLFKWNKTTESIISSVNKNKAGN